MLGRAACRTTCVEDRTHRNRRGAPGSPLDPDCLPEFDYLYLPRLREDLRHSPALQLLNRRTRILIPGLLPNRFTDRLKELGFAHDRDVWLGWSTRVRCPLPGQHAPDTRTTRRTPSGAFVSGFALVSPYLLWMN